MTTISINECDGCGNTISENICHITITVAGGDNMSLGFTMYHLCGKPCYPRFSARLDTIMEHDRT